MRGYLEGGGELRENNLSVKKKVGWKLQAKNFRKCPRRTVFLIIYLFILIKKDLWGIPYVTYLISAPLFFIFASIPSLVLFLESNSSNKMIWEAN